MANFLTKVQDILEKPLIRKVTAGLLESAIPRLRAKIGEDPVVAFGGLATFLAWLAGRLPAKLAKPVQGAVALLAILGAKATVTPSANPKVVLTVPLAPPTPAPAGPAGAKPTITAKPVPAGPVVKVTVPLVPSPREQVQDAVSGAVAKLKGLTR